MFNFNYDQGAGNNRCGGYSLAAIATNLRPMVNHNPQIVYNFLRGWQRNLGPNSQILVNATNLGGTDILLPSTFLVAHYAQLNYALYLNRQTYLNAAQLLLLQLGIVADNIITEETQAIGGQHNVQQIPDNLQQFLNAVAANNHQYWLVLVNNATHWVAIERDPNGQYCIYNPAGGINAVANIAGDVITYTDSHNIAHTDNWSGIAISVINT